MNKLCISLALLLVCNSGIAANYYVNNNTGKDSNSGTSAGAPWKSVGKVNNTTFKPGDQIHFQSGNVWVVNTNTELRPKGSGNGSNRIVMKKYGGAAFPQVEGTTQNQGTAGRLTNQNDWTVQQMIFSRAFTGFLIHAVNTTVRRVTVKDCRFIDCGYANGSTAAQGLRSGGEAFANVRAFNNWLSNVARGLRMEGQSNLQQYIEDNSCREGGSGLFFNSFAVSGQAANNHCVNTRGNVPIQWAAGSRISDNNGYTVRDNLFENVRRGNSQDGCGFDFEQGNKNISYINNDSKNNDGSGIMVIKKGQTDLSINNCDLYKNARNPITNYRDTCMYVKKDSPRNTGSVSGGVWTRGQADHYLIDQFEKFPVQWTMNGVTEN